MYGLSSRDSLSKIQTRWVTAVEETTKVIHLTPPKADALQQLRTKISELENISSRLEERIAALEARCGADEVHSETEHRLSPDICALSCDLPPEEEEPV